MTGVESKAKHPHPQSNPEGLLETRLAHPRVSLPRWGRTGAAPSCCRPWEARSPVWGRPLLRSTLRKPKGKVPKTSSYFAEVWNSVSSKTAAESTVRCR